jgi:tRNA pseudouridine55 synthase
VDKGTGVTSFQAVALLRRLLRAPRVGHGGTLDPDATGLLPVLVGEATKLMPYLADLDKEYVATVRLGLTTDTRDTSGAVRATRPVPALDEATLRATLGRFVGEIEQVPPMYSALHHQGRRLYEIARAGGEVERHPRRVTIHEIELLSVAPPDLALRVVCGKGTYIRVLAADLGDALGPGAALAALRRTRVGPFTVDRAVPWPLIREARDPEPLWQRLLPADAALAGWPEIRLGGPEAQAFLHGRAVPVPVAAGRAVRVYAPGGAFLGVGRGHGAGLRPERLFHADPPRPVGLPR